MDYLTYEEYMELGGTLELTAFKRYIDRANGIIDNATHGRIKKMEKTPKGAKALCRDLVDFLAHNQGANGVVSSRSQSAGGVSESESYAIANKEEILQEIDNIVFDYLASEKDDCGTPLLYRGCARW